MQHYEVRGTLLITEGPHQIDIPIRRSPIPAQTEAEAREAVRWSYALVERHPDDAVVWASDVLARPLSPVRML